MSLKVVGAGVGRTGTKSLKLALEQLLGGRCHHMVEVLEDPSQMPGWIEAIEGVEVDWGSLLGDYVAQVDWPGASFWREISAANPDALVLLSVRDPELWYRSASDTIFLGMAQPPPEMEPWLSKMREMMGERFCNELDSPTAMIDAFERHNGEVRAGVPSERLLEWTVSEGWEPICERLAIPVPDEPFPATNNTTETRAALGMPALA